MSKAPPKVSASPPRKPWHNNSATKRKITGRALQRERAKLFADQPLCIECAKHGRVSQATIRDHRVALAFGGLDIASNTQGLCQACSDEKTRAESAEGQRRSR